MRSGDWLREHNEVAYYFLKGIYCVLTGNREYIHKRMYMDMNPDIMEVCHLGEKNEGQIIFYIKEVGTGWGFFAEFNTLLEELLYAERLGLKPCVEFGERFGYYEKDGVDGEKNAFEYYFEPIGNVNLIKESCNVVYSRACCYQYIEDIYGVDKYYIPEILENELSQILQKYIYIKSPLRKKFDEQYYDMFSGERVLGVHYRGTDYKVGYNVHPVQVKIEQTIEKIKAAFHQYPFQYIFLATDEKGIYERLREEFGDCVYQYSDVFRGEENVSIAFSQSERKQHHFRLGLEVLRDVYTLSKCDGLVAGLSQVSRAAKMFKKSRGESYRFLEIIDNGINSNNIVFSLEDVKKGGIEEKDIGNN